MSPLRVLGGVVLALANACATAAAVPPGSEAATLSIQNLICSDCGKELESRALKVAGVQAAHFDAKHVELQLQLARGTALPPVMDAVRAEPVDGRVISASSGAGKGAYAPFAVPPPTADVKTLSLHGEDVRDLREGAGPGKVTVMDFYADWCGPCHLLDEHMQTVLAHDANVAYRRLNVVDWDSPLAKHYLSGVEGLPYVIVLSARGSEVAKLSGASPESLDAALAKERGR